MKQEGGQNWTPITPPEGSIFHAETHVTAYLATNKWFAVTLNRSLPADKAAELLKALKDNGSVPDDAFMTVGNTYVKSVCCSD